MPQYVAVAANTSGSTPKDLFEDVAEELEKQVVKVFYILKRLVSALVGEEIVYFNPTFYFISITRTRLGSKRR